MTERQVNDAMIQMDKDGSGEIDYEVMNLLLNRWILCIN